MVPYSDGVDTGRLITIVLAAAGARTFALAHGLWGVVTPLGTRRLAASVAVGPIPAAIIGAVVWFAL